MYTADINRKNPGAFLFLVDQSGSMSDRLPSGESKAQFLADRLNELVRELIVRCSRADGVRDYYEVGVIGYGGQGVRTAFAGPLATEVLNPLSRIDANPRSHVERVRRLTRPVTRTARVRDPYAMAFHQGGLRQVLQVAIATMVDRGMLVGPSNEAPFYIRNDQDQASHPVERTIQAYCAVPRRAPILLDDPELRTPLEVECSVYENMSPAEAGIEVVERRIRIPCWFEPVAEGSTPMCEALRTAARTLAEWCDLHPESFPPIVIHITDGESTDGDPVALGQQMQKIGTQDGDLLLFNLHISTAASGELLFCDSAAPLPDAFSRGLWQMSSVLPSQMLAAAQREGFPVTTRSRCFGYNARMDSIVRFLEIGTRPGKEAV